MPRRLWKVDFDEDSPRIQVTPGVTVPEVFAYTVSPPDVPLSATVHMRIRGGNAICERAEVERYDGKSLTAQDIRGVAFGQLIAGAAPMAAMFPRPGSADPGDLVAPEVNLEEADLERVQRAVQAQPHIPVELADVARVYRDALATGKPPTATVADTFQLSPRTASRRVADARKAGHLGAAIERRAGERAMTSGEGTN